MNLSNKYFQGILLAILGFILLRVSPHYHDTGSLRPAYAFETKGTFLIFYALLTGALVGLTLRYLKRHGSNRNDRKSDYYDDKL